MTTAQPALSLGDVRKVYRSGESEVVALDSTDLVVDGDEMIALVGPSGSGKTTLLSIAGGLLTPTSGTVEVAGENITSYDAKRLTKFRGQNIGFVFQAVNLVPFLTARENLTIVAEMNGRGGKAARARATDLLDELGLRDRLGNLPDQLSGGERQRVAIGRALMNEPGLVLFDEPTSALDSKLGAQVMELIRSEIKGRATAAIVVTHDIRMTDYADKTLRIEDGVLLP